jgi:hypothetical protein
MCLTKNRIKKKSLLTMYIHREDFGFDDCSRTKLSMFVKKAKLSMSVSFVLVPKYGFDVVWNQESVHIG